jgi:hypothetical protein
MGDEGRQQQRLGDVRAPVVDDRLQPERANRLLVPERVRGDREAGEQRERDGAAPVLGLRPRRAAGACEREHRGDDDPPAGQRERARVLGEDHERGEGREQRARPARERVDEREVAVAVAALQQHEVQGV